MKKNNSSVDVKMDAISNLSINDIEKAASINNDMPLVRLTRLFKGSAMTENEIMDLVGITFVLEALILSEKMRDTRLTDLEQDQVENLAMELYLHVDKLRGEGEGYWEMGDAANNIIDKHLSRIDAETSQ